MRRGEESAAQHRDVLVNHLNKQHHQMKSMDLDLQLPKHHKTLLFLWPNPALRSSLKSVLFNKLRRLSSSRWCFSGTSGGEEVILSRSVTTSVISADSSRKMNQLGRTANQRSSAPCVTLPSSVHRHELSPLRHWIAALYDIITRGGHACLIVQQLWSGVSLRSTGGSCQWCGAPLQMMNEPVCQAEGKISDR